MTVRLSGAWRGRALPSAPCCGKVHSVFARACNLLLEEETLAALTAPELPRAAWSVRVAGLPVPFSTLLHPGMACFFNAENIFVPQANTEDCLPVADASPCASVNWRVVRAQAQARGWPGFCRIFTSAHPTEDPPFMRTARLAADTLTRAFRQKSPDAALAAALSLTGLGVGLTPSGDDFLGGFLAGMHAGSGWGDARRFLEAFCRNLERQAAGATTLVSFTFLRHACSGSFSEHVRELARALTSAPQDAARLHQLTEQVLAFGGTSGADTLAGLIHAGGLLCPAGEA